MKVSEINVSEKDNNFEIILDVSNYSKICLISDKTNYKESSLDKSKNMILSRINEIDRDITNLKKLKKLLFKCQYCLIFAAIVSVLILFGIEFNM